MELAPIVPRYAGMLPDPYAIYAAARAYWENARYPSFLTYTVDVRVNEAGQWKSNHYHLAYDAARDAVIVDPVSDEEREHPHVVPPGFNVNVFVMRVSKPESRTDYLGVPNLAPNYSFGIAKYVPRDAIDSAELVRQIRDEFHDPAPMRSVKATGSGLPEIADVHAYARDYAITLAGVEPVGGHPDFHLKLAPLHAPKRYRLRDMWVDERTYFTDRVVSDGNFTSGPGPGVTWVVTFADVGGAPYILDERAQGRLSFAGASYDDASVTFEDIQAAERSYRWAGDFKSSGDLLEEP